jgi:hypothetical protein
LYLGDGAEFPRVSLIGSGSGNSNSLIYGQNSLFRSLGNSREKARKEADSSTRWAA